MGKRRPANVRERAYYIRRLSLRDDDNSLFFCDTTGRKIRFSKVSHCLFILSSFRPEQQAKIVLLPVGDEDRDYADWLPEVLPGTVKPEAYLGAVEQTVQARRANREPSSRELNALERYMNRRI